MVSGGEWGSGARHTKTHQTTQHHTTSHLTPPHPIARHPTPLRDIPPHPTPPRHTTPHRRIETETFPKGLSGKIKIKYSETTYFDLLCCLAFRRNADYGAWVPQSDTKYVLLVVTVY